jgi:two-component system response regulator HydG
MSDPGGGKILLVDDEPNALRVLSAILSQEGYETCQAKNVEEAMKRLSSDLDAAITDMRMPDRDGMQLFEYVSRHFPDLPVIFLTAYGTVDSAVQAMTRGAFYYVIKPPDYAALKGILARAVTQRRLKREVEQLKSRLAAQDRMSPINGKTPAMQRVLKQVVAIRDSECSVLVCGDTGTGKELIARALHFQSSRKSQPFVAVNCAAIPGQLIESELFGYEKGAFTGALAKRIGRVEEASGGTLFLDEIGELELSVQAKLLRVLQEKEIVRLGSNRKVKVDFRLISSTNRDLAFEVQSGNFREDLFYRLNVVKIDLPPLRERRDDIPFLVSEFLSEFCAREGKTLTISGEVLQVIQDHSWPGNIRQLRNIVERAVVLAQGPEITTQELPQEFSLTSPRRPSSEPVRTLKEMEVQAVRQALEQCGGNKSNAAKMLGFSRKSLYKRLREFGIS